MADKGAKDLARVVKYIANLKVWLRKEQKWQRDVANELRRLRRKAGVKGPTVTTPPNPPFRP